MKISKALNAAPSKFQILALTACISSISSASEEAGTNIFSLQKSTSVKESFVISTDGLGKTDSNKNIIIGDGTGDLVLVVYDPSSKSPRKKSLMLDLSSEDKQGNINDLNLSDVSQLHEKATISNSALSTFIKTSKSPDNILWQVFAITNHYELGDTFGSINLINFGFATTELTKRTIPLTHQELHQSKIHRAQLIDENITYGINTNESLISYTGEPSAFDMRIHHMLADGMQASGKLNQELIFGTHKLQSKYDKNASNGQFFTHFHPLGHFKINQSIDNKDWQLIFVPAK